MRNPWDIPPFPKRGDVDENVTYTEVGRAISNWEGLEFNLSRVHSALVGDPDGDAMRQYGTGRIFRDRLKILIDSANEHFVRCPDQEGEGGFDRLVAHLVGFSDRRNDVAHGIVFPVQRLNLINQHFDKDLRDQKQWALIPPYHTIRHHSSDGVPLYVYTSVELRELSDGLIYLNYVVDLFRNTLLPPEAQRRLPLVRPPWPDQALSS